MPEEYAKDRPSGFKNRVENIAIVGATGSVGSYITESLLKNGKHTVTALTRADSKSTMPDGVKVAKINYDDESTLVEALKGQDALIITMKAGQQEAEHKLIAAAAKAKVEWVMPNEYGPDVTADTAMGQESLLLAPIAAAHELVEKLGVSSWVGLTCSFWYQFSLANTPNAYGFDFKGKKVTFFDDGKTKINTSTWAQCGRAVASLFALPVLPQDENDKGPYLNQWRNKELHIDSFLLSQRDMLDSILRVTGDKESDWAIEYEPSLERYKRGQEDLKGGDRMRGYITCMYTRVFYQDGCGDYSDRLDNERLGLPKEDLDEETKGAIRMVEEGYNYFAR